MDLIEEYEELGLTKNEGKAYEILVKKGKLGAGEVSKFSGVPYSRVYDVLDSLIQKNLVVIVPEKSKKFLPNDPNSFFELVSKKEAKLRKVKEHVEKMKDFYDNTHKNPVTMSIGRKGFYKTVKELKKPEKYNYSIKWSAEYKYDRVGKIKNLIKKGIDVKTLTRFDKETEEDVKKWNKVDKKIKKIKNEGVALSIIDDEETMVSLIKSNVTLSIKDKSFAKVMKILFTETYKNAKKTE